MKKMFFVVIFITLLLLISVGFSQTAKNLIAENTFTEKVFKVDSLALFGFIEDKQNEAKIQDYFKARSMPLSQYAGTFIKVARKYNLDPFLLPSISIMESTGGKAKLFKPFNPFGFGKKEFSSFDESIDYIGFQLSNGKYYKGKTLYKKLTTYNSIKDNYFSETVRIIKNIQKQKVEKIDPGIYVDSFKVEINQDLKAEKVIM